MRRTILFVVAAVLAVVAMPVLGVGQVATVQGGSPSDVFMSTGQGEDPVCADFGIDGATAMPTVVDVGGLSHLLVYFTAEWGGLNTREEGLLGISLLDDGGDTVASTPFEWGVPGRDVLERHATTVMWTFEDVSAGENYTVLVNARVDPMPPGGLPTHGHLAAGLNDCALTVFVIPVAA
jgi:hypothetical protein